MKSTVRLWKFSTGAVNICNFWLSKKFRVRRKVKKVTSVTITWYFLKRVKTSAVFDLADSVSKIMDPSFSSFLLAEIMVRLSSSPLVWKFNLTSFITRPAKSFCLRSWLITELIWKKRYQFEKQNMKHSMQYKSAFWWVKIGSGGRGGGCNFGQKCPAPILSWTLKSQYERSTTQTWK